VSKTLPTPASSTSTKDSHDLRSRDCRALRDHEPELRAAGVVRLFVFGSAVRGDGQPDSDIDLLASFDESRRLSLLDLVGIELRLAGLLGQPVDLVEEGMLKPRVERSVEAEAVRAF
jgi:predicted nucleotidyltransferase